MSMSHYEGVEVDRSPEPVEGINLWLHFRRCTIVCNRREEGLTGNDGTVYCTKIEE